MSYCFGNPDMKRKPRPGEWSAEETAQLRQFAREGLTQREAAERLGRSETSVRDRSFRRKIRWARSQSPWTGREIARLRKLAPTHTMAEVAQLLERGIHGIEEKASALGISFRKHGRAHHTTKLTSADIVQVFKLRQDGFSLKEIADRFGCSRNHVWRVLSLDARWRESLPFLLEKTG